MQSMHTVGGYRLRRWRRSFQLCIHSFSIAAALLAGAASAQEPGLLQGHQAVRFQEAAGVFHYITPCYETKADASGDETALCWAVMAAHVQRVDGKLSQSATVNGVLKVSADQVRFVPELPNAEFGDKAFPQAGIAFGHKAGSTEGRVGGKDEVYLFAFRNTCFGCAAGTMQADLGKTDQLDAEFELFHEALTDFGAVDVRLRELSKEVRVKVERGNQPVSAGPVLMGQYADINRRLAALCDDPAKSCLLKYASFQACKAGAAPADCGPAPDCSAELLLPKDFDRKGTSVILPKDKDVAEVRPVGVGPVRLSAGVSAGQILEKVSPAYPPIAKARHQGGTVVLRAMITKEGTVDSLTVISTTDAIFNDAALEAVKKWRYKPYLLNGAPTEVDTVVTVNFNMNPRPGPPPLVPLDGARPTPIPGMPPE